MLQPPYFAVLWVAGLEQQRCPEMPQQWYRTPAATHPQPVVAPCRADRAVRITYTWGASSCLVSCVRHVLHLDCWSARLGALLGHRNSRWAASNWRAALCRAPLSRSGPGNQAAVPRDRRLEQPPPHSSQPAAAAAHPSRAHGMERLRASLSLQIPSSLLPSSRAPGLPDSDSQDSLEEGLTLRPVTAFGRSTSGPAAATASRPQLQGPVAEPQRSVTLPAGGKPADADIAVHVNGAGGGAGSQQAPPAASPVQRAGSRQPSHGTMSSCSNSMAGDPAVGSPSAASEPSAEPTSAPSASHGAFSPQPASERYSEEFEAEEDSRSQPAATVSPGATSSSHNPAPRSAGRPAARPASAAVGRTGSSLSPARSPSVRQLSRSGSSRPGYLSPAAAKEVKRGTPTASVPSSRPASASPSKQPARCGLGCCAVLSLLGGWMVVGQSSMHPSLLAGLRFASAMCCRSFHAHQACLWAHAGGTCGAAV